MRLKNFYNGRAAASFANSSGMVSLGAAHITPYCGPNFIPTKWINLYIGDSFTRNAMGE